MMQVKAVVATLCASLTSQVFIVGAEFRISEVSRSSDGAIELKVEGSSDSPVTLQATSDFQGWKDLQTFELKGAPLTYTDGQAGTVRARSYRLRSSWAQAAPLPDLGGLVNRVFPAPEGFNTVQFARDGKLGFIFWRDTDLVFRERTVDGVWVEQVVSGGGNVFKPYLKFDFSTPREDYRFQPSAVLLYDSLSRPHIFKVNGRSILHYGRSNGWTVEEVISNPAANADLAVLEAAVGSGDVFHFAALSSGSPRNLTYGTNLGGQWNWTTISVVTDPPLTYWAPPFAARWLAMDVDSRNHAHIAFRSSLDLTYDSASHPRAYSELKYASNVSGQWSTAIVSKPRDLSGEAANGASIAIAPDDRPRILSWYDERADSGSAQESRMYFHQQDSQGNWTAGVVVDKADGYIAGDGNKGAGFSPYLRFDPSGRAHILFMDHAGEHFGNVGQQEYAGNLRHAWSNGRSWSFRTVFAQTAPLKQEVVYPAFAVSGSEMAVAVLQRDTQWNYSSFPPLSDSKYYFRFFTDSLP